MKLPFTVDQFMSVFEQYNLTVWPMQVIAYLIGALIIFLAIKKTKFSDKIIFTLLSFLWIWNGIVYHILNFSSINRLAYFFGILFVLQGVMFLVLGVWSNKLSFQMNPGIYSITGGLFIIYAMVIYPLLGHYLGHGFPRSPSFGIAPCPTTIFTFGLLLWMDLKMPVKISLIPLVWSFIGFSAALSLGVKEDFGLLAAGVIGFILLLFKNRRNPVVSNEVKNLCSINTN